MKVQYCIVFLLLLLSVGCLQHKEASGVSVEMEQIEIQECEKLCHRLKISIRNLTGDSIFLPSLYLPDHLFVIDNKKKEYRFSDFFEQENSYYREHVKAVFRDSFVLEYDGPFLIDYDSLSLFFLQQSGKYYNLFAEKATAGELEKMVRKYHLIRMGENDTDFLKDLIKAKYSSFVLLTPRSSVHETFNVNTMVGKGYKFYFKYKSFNKNEEGVKIELGELGKMIEIRSDYPAIVNGYKLFEGRIYSTPFELK